MNITEARSEYNDAVKRMNDAAQAIEDASADADLDALAAAFDDANASVERSKQIVSRLELVAEARKNSPAVEIPEIAVETPESTATVSGAEGRTFHAVPKGGRTEHVYRPNNDNGNHYFRDLWLANTKGDSQAADRLAVSARQSREEGKQYRDLTTTATDGGGFVPPLYMGELWAAAPRPDRPFANHLGSRPLPSTGMSITLPRVTTAPATAAQTTENTGMNETELVEATVTTPVVTIGGIEDVSVQLLERSEPGIDVVIWDALRGSYDSVLDTQLLAGSGATGYHRGIKNVSGTNAVTYSDYASPTAAELTPKLFDAIQKVASTRYRPADTIIMHPRRAAWLASNLSSTFPLFQQGGLYQAAGTQNQGFVSTLAGLTVILDANIAVTYGTPTATEDTIYVVRASDLILFEDGLKAEVFRETLSAEGTVRFRLYGYSAFVSGRYPTAIAEITGQGLVTPTF